MFAPLGANSGFPLYEGFAWSIGIMNASACGARPSDVKDFDDFCQAQLAYAALLAQGIMNNVESFICAEGTGSDWSFGAAIVEVGAGGVVGWIWKGARIWIGVVVVGGLRVSVLYSVHIHVHEAGRVIKSDRVCFVSCCNILHKLCV